MPLIEVKVFEDEFDESERAALITAITDATVSLTGEGIRPYTWVIVEEVKSGNWGSGRPTGQPPRRASHPSRRLTHRA